jgi:methionine aminopeptidase
MTDISLVTNNKVDVVESIIQMTLPAAETLAPGDAVRLDVSTGKFTKANGTTAAEARIYGIAVGQHAVPAGMPITAIRKGVLSGHNLAALAYDQAILLSNTDGTLADAAGTVSVTVGRVIPGTSSLIGSAYDKLLFIDL